MPPKKTPGGGGRAGGGGGGRGGVHLVSTQEAANRKVAGIFGSRDTSAATGQPAAEGVPKKLKAARLSKEDQKRRVLEEQRARRLEQDRVNEEHRQQQEKQLQLQIGAPSILRGRPPLQHNPIPTELFEKELDTSIKLTGHAPPDLERYMRKRAQSLPERRRNEDVFMALDRRLWPSCAVPSPSDFFFRTHSKCFGPPSTTYFLDPSLFGVRPQCQQCLTCNKTVPSHWTLKPLFGVGTRDYVMYRHWRCKNCDAGAEDGAAVTPTIPFAFFYNSLPQDVKASLPLHPDCLFKNYYVDKKLVTYIDAMMVKSTGAQIARSLKEIEIAQWVDYHHNYAVSKQTTISTAAATKEKTATTTTPSPTTTTSPRTRSVAKQLPTQITITEMSRQSDNTTTPSTFEDLDTITGRSRWATLHLSDDTISSIYKSSSEKRKHHQNNITYQAGGIVLYCDHTFREAKHIRVDGEPISTILTFMNEQGKIVRQWAVRTKSLHEMKEALKAHYNSYVELGLEQPKVIYVDNVEEVEALLKECYPSVLKENGGYGIKQCPPHRRGCHITAGTVGAGRERLTCTLLQHVGTNAFIKRMSSRTTLRLYYKANRYFSIYFLFIRR